MIKLTEEQTEGLREIVAETQAVAEILRVALGFHQNILKQIKKKERDWWEEVFASHGLDMTVAYTTKDFEGQKYITPVEKDEC